MKSKLAVFLFCAANALAAPREGSVAPNARVVDADDNVLELSRLRGKPILVVYEDKDSAELNKDLKDDLSKLAKGDRYKKAIALIAVADVKGYDYWPVRGFVKSAIRSESNKIGTTIYCDWTGDFKNALSLRGSTSNVVLIGKDGKIIFSREGKVSAADRTRLIDLLRAQL